jgi:hypothetical protein
MLCKRRPRCPPIHGNGQLYDRGLVRRFAHRELAGPPLPAEDRFPSTIPEPAPEPVDPATGHTTPERPRKPASTSTDQRKSPSATPGTFGKVQTRQVSGGSGWYRYKLTLLKKTHPLLGAASLVQMKHPAAARRINKWVATGLGARRLREVGTWIRHEE